jgi:predicted ATPase
MLREVQLENFKCFGERVKIPLAPITLIFGQNSVGKSAILQALCLLKQTKGFAPRTRLFSSARKWTGFLDAWRR